MEEGTNKGGKTKVLQCSLKTLSQTARSGYLFSCLITCANGYKVGHEKQINKVLFPCVDMLHLLQFWHGGRKQKHVEQLKFYSYD